jgi:hypothetical protein
MAHLGLMAAAGSIIYFVVCCFALLRGGPPERVVAAVMLLDFILVPLFFNRRDIGANLPFLMAGDATILIVLLGSLFRWRKIWLVFATASQAFSVLISWARLAGPGISGWVYVSAGIIASYGLLIALATAVLLGMRRVKR